MTEVTKEKATAKHDPCELCQDGGMQSDGSQSPQQQKLMTDLDVKTNRDLALLLNKNYPPGVDVWQPIAEKYGLEIKFINELERLNENPGKSLLHYLGAAHPSLTVKDFYGTSKDHERDDIVDFLKNHLWKDADSVPTGNNRYSRYH